MPSQTFTEDYIFCKMMIVSEKGIFVDR